MRITLFPDHIKIGLDRETLALITRILNRLDAIDQAEVDALTSRLKAARLTLIAGLAANPDPNPND